MRIVLLFSVWLGLLWNIIAVCLLGGRVTGAFRPSWLLAGALAGIVAGVFTIWSRKRREGEESLFLVLATYYLGIVTYWATFVVVERITMCIRHGGWTDFDLRDHLVLVWTFLFYGTLWFGIILIPLTFLSRYMLWAVYKKYGDWR